MEKQNKKILIFSLAYLPFVGGAEIAIDEITKRIDKDKCEFHLITLRYDKSLPRYERMNSVYVHRIGWGMKNPKVSESLNFWLALQKFFFPFLAIGMSLRVIKKYNISTYWFMLLNQSTLTKYFLPKRYSILSLQDGRRINDHFTSFSKIFRSLFKKIIKKMDLVQVISSFIMKDVNQFKIEDVVLIPNGVDVELFSEEIDDEKIKEIRKKYNFEDDDKIIITASRLVPSRGVESLISSIADLPKNYKALILGEGYVQNKLEELAKDLGVENRIFFAGLIKHDEIPNYLKASDIFVRASLHEGMGNGFIEAMAAKIPVIGTPVGGINDFLFDQETGLLCEVGNPKSISDAILKLEDGELREKLINEAYRQVKERYSWKKIAAYMESIFLSNK